ncbi:Tn3 family transposase [Nonomuraea thailandensis]|uniref:Tn3 family transposase n=1 Tax=Nonomuraea thailandensis TaxID=1188745 RepID=UPI0035566135
MSSITLLRRLRHDSKRNKIYRAFRELGRVIHTMVLIGASPTPRCGRTSPGPPTWSSPSTTSPSGSGSATTA